MLSKKEVRKQLRERRDALDAVERMQKSEEIQKKLFILPEFLQAEQIFTYVSYGSEVDTMKLIENCFLAEKQVFVPKVYPDRQMKFYQIFSLEDLQKGFRGILEPKEEETRLAKEKAKEGTAVMLLPGLGFGENGSRLGYGGGYYDTYLAHFSQDTFETIGLCFDCQFMETTLWKTETTDISVKKILTESRIKTVK